MTSIYIPVSQADLTQRRASKRRQRRIKACQAIWRALIVSSLAGGLVWETTQPSWVIRYSEQIDIEGNQLLSDTAIRELLPLKYPQSLLRLQPQVIAAYLESQPPIAEATVNRQLLPPRLTIEVKERQPVALAQLAETSNNTPSHSGAVALLDAQGVWIPIDSYKALKHPLQLPTLKVIGFTAQNRPYWPSVYQAVSRSAVKVFEINFQDPLNLVFKTQLGSVHLGAYSSRLPKQLSVLDRLRELPAHINVAQIAYIDLKNPASPSIQMKAADSTLKKDSNQAHN